MNQVNIEDEVETVVPVWERFLSIADDQFKARVLLSRFFYHVLTYVETVAAGIEKLGKYRKIICRPASHFENVIGVTYSFEDMLDQFFVGVSELRISLRNLVERKSLVVSAHSIHL
ncbi:protein of unknown function [Mesotoga infera]|uniref:Uncharacterized protein n=1 Tax=Mesotoga infera TaxID=1236046 RepID=A0A7Z7LHU2_9BACT|nr:protein of unknown function [Mesotoga infera]